MSTVFEASVLDGGLFTIDAVRAAMATVSAESIRVAGI